jgi:hypothetical protein
LQFTIAFTLGASACAVGLAIAALPRRGPVLAPAPSILVSAPTA